MQVQSWFYNIVQSCDCFPRMHECSEIKSRSMYGNKCLQYNLILECSSPKIAQLIDVVNQR